MTTSLRTRVSSVMAILFAVVVLVPGALLDGTPLAGRDTVRVTDG